MSARIITDLQGDRHRSWTLLFGWYLSHVHSPYQHPAESKPTTAHRWRLARGGLSISLAYGSSYGSHLPDNWDVIYRAIIEQEDKRVLCPSCKRPRVYGTHYPCVPPPTCVRCGNPTTMF